MTVEQLIQEVEPLTYVARVQYMLELGRKVAQDADSAALIAELEQGDFYERLLAILSCYGSRDGSHVLRALSDPSRTIRGFALKLLPLACSEEQMRQALALATGKSQLALLRKLHHSGHLSVIDDFLETLAQKNDSHFLQFLPFGSAACVQRHQEKLLRTHEVAHWLRLAHSHPTLTVEMLQTWIDGTPGVERTVLFFANAVLPILVKKQADQALALVTTLAHHVALNQIELQGLILSRPNEIADLLLSSNQQVTTDFNSALRKLDTQHLLLLLEKMPEVVNNYLGSFGDFRPEKRLAIYNARAYGMADTQGCITPVIIGLLPAKQREQEARRHLALPVLATKPAERLPYAAFLPWSEAKDILFPFLHDPDAEMRSLALKTLANAVRYQRNHLPELLTIIKNRGNEQDPVRGVMLRGLAELPRSIWQTEHREVLEHIIRDALNAIDISYQTVYYLYPLVFNLRICDSAWSAQQLAALALRFDFKYANYALDEVLTDAEVQQYAPALQPVFESWLAHENEEALLVAAQRFDRRLRVLDGLARTLEDMLKRTRNMRFVDGVLPLIIRYRPEQAAQLIPALLADDPSWITRPDLYTYLHRHRQDLLTPFLGQRAYSGRFSTGQTRFVQLFRKGFERWTRQQQEIFETTLLEVITDTQQSHANIIWVIRQLAALPAVSAIWLISLRHDDRPLVRDTVLLLLATLDAGQGIPALLEELQGKNARVAIYALRTYCMQAPVQETLTLLRQIPLTQVTVAKERVRLQGELPGEEAYQELLALDRQELHRDVRVALLRTLWLHLERPETWDILEREARSSDRTLALSTVRLSLGSSKEQEQEMWRRRYYSSIYARRRLDNATASRYSSWVKMNATRITVDNLSSDIQHRLMSLFTLLLDHSQLEVRATVLKACTRVPAADSENKVLGQLLAFLDSSNVDICKAAASAIFSTCVAEDAPVVGQGIQQLLSHRRALASIVDVLQDALVENRIRLLPVVRTVLTALASDPLTSNLRVALALSALPDNEVVPFLTDVVRAGELHAYTLETASTVVQQTGDYRDDATWRRLEIALATNEDERLRSIALAVMQTRVQLAGGWNEELRSRLHIYQTDPSLLVASKAQFIFPPAEA